MSQSRRERRKFRKRRARDNERKRWKNLRKGGSPYVWSKYL